MLKQLVEVAAFEKLFVLPAYQTPSYIFLSTAHCPSCLGENTAEVSELNCISHCAQIHFLK